MILLLVLLCFIPVVALLIVCLTLVAFGRWYLADSRTPLFRRFWISVIEVGGVVAAIRSLTLWYMTYRRWSGTDDDLIDPFFRSLLYPELLWIPDPITHSNLGLSIGVMTIGSFAIVLMVAFIVRVHYVAVEDEPVNRLPQ
jgi:hypothetical protein